LKILVTSDSHGFLLPLMCAIEAEQPDMLIFLGDGVRDLRQVRRTCRRLRIEHVRGNCDGWNEGEEERLLQLEGHSVLLLHGHTRGVKQDLEPLYVLAKKRKAEWALYGHTHIPAYIEKDGIALLNPGSIGRREGASYAVLEVEDLVRCRLVTL
jgi:putative phosphoesterase